MSPVVACLSFAPLRAGFVFFWVQMLLSVPAMLAILARRESPLRRAVCNGSLIALVAAWAVLFAMTS